MPFLEQNTSVAPGWQQPAADSQRGAWGGALGTNKPRTVPSSSSLWRKLVLILGPQIYVAVGEQQLFVLQRCTMKENRGKNGNLRSLPHDTHAPLGCLFGPTLTAQLQRWIPPRPQSGMIQRYRDQPAEYPTSSISSSSLNHPKGEVW